MATLPDLSKLSAEDMLKEIARLKGENAQLKANQTKALQLKVSDKGAVMLLGLRRFPVTFYAQEWNKILAIKDRIEAFIEANKDDLSTKEG